MTSTSNESYSSLSSARSVRATTSGGSEQIGTWKLTRGCVCPGCGTPAGIFEFAACSSISSKASTRAQETSMPPNSQTIERTIAEISYLNNIVLGGPLQAAGPAISGL